MFRISLKALRVKIFSPPCLFMKINSLRYLGTKRKIIMPKPPSPTYSQKEDIQKFSLTVTYLNIIAATAISRQEESIYSASLHFNFFFSLEKSIDIKNTPNKMTNDPNNCSTESVSPRKIYPKT